MNRILAGFLVFLLLITQYRLWLGENGILELYSLREQVAAQEKENRRLSQRNQRLNAEVEDLKGSLEAVEERARFDLGMVGPEETFIWLVGEPPPVFRLPAALKVQDD